MSGSSSRELLRVMRPPADDTFGSRKKRRKYQEAKFDDQKIFQIGIGQCIIRSV